MKSFIGLSHELNSLAEVGGKGFHLQKLVSFGANVADFFILKTDVHDAYKKNTIPSEVTEALKTFINKHGQIALRSSMMGEDQLDASFAGLFETILNVDLSNWEEALTRIYESSRSERVREYISQKNIKTDLKMAVVVQKQINVEKSGVLFTRSPLAPTSAIAIDAAYGMGEGVVSGYADVDHYLTTRNGEVLKEVLNSGLPVLSRDEMSELITTSLDLEEKFSHPSDIEWGYESGKLFIFQIRPITRDFSKIESFVDTNLSESYPGVVSPFTAEFVKVAYRNVYTESAIIFGASGERLVKLKFHYNKLISCVDNHLYYNLEHYYAILRALPGGEKNIINWHKMIGGSPDKMRVPYHQTELTKGETLSALFHLIKLGFTKEKVYGQFLEDLTKIKSIIESELPKLHNSKEAIRFMNGLIERPLGFGLTVANDVFIMIGMGILRHRLKKKNESELILIELLKTSHSLDSLKPLHVLNKLAQDLSNECLAVISQSKLDSGLNPYFNVFSNLRESNFLKELQLIEVFLRDYGDRSFEELKLESLPIKNNPSLFLELIKWAKMNDVHFLPHENPAPSITLSKFENYILKFTRECIALRETTRLWRGKFYHLLRQSLMNLSRLLAKEDESWKTYSLMDFFSITHLEWLKYSEGALSKEQIQSFMNERQIWKTPRNNYPEMIQWSSCEPLPTLESSNSMDSSFQGQGVSAGIVEATALVLDNPQEAFHTDLKDFILITKNTDPAWVYIMSRSKGLISEKGSLLSHTAIIGRELGIPTVVGFSHATKNFRTGDRIRMNGQTGEVTKL